MNIAVFTSPYDRDKTEQIVADVIRELKGTYRKNVGKWKDPRVLDIFAKKYRFFYGKVKDGTAVRVVFDSLLPRSAWMGFIKALNSKYGDVFGLSADWDYKPVAVIAMKNQVRQVYTSRTSGSPSLLGFLLGGAAFGEAGAIVGGLSGRQQTTTDVYEYKTGLVDVTILWSDGCIIEDTIREDSDLYNEILMMNPENV